MSGQGMKGQVQSALLSCRGVSKNFGALAAVKDLSFEIYPGEVLGIGGPNGAGKTTLFDMISGINPVDAGEVVLAGNTITSSPPERICHQGLARIFQFNAAFDTLTVRENVIIGATYGHSDRIFPPLRLDRASRMRADEAIEMVGLAERANQLAANIPALDRKLLMIASALATSPKLLLMDEPVGGLNPGEIDRVMALVQRLREDGMTMILIEHVMRFLVQLSTRVLIMHHGEKIYEGLPEGLAQDETVAEVYLGEGMARRIARFLEDAG
jgi:branched-chain amino acid transport system ATP-binding protein